MEILKKLEWDSDFFSYQVGEIVANGLSEEIFAKTLNEAKLKNYRLVYAKIPPDDLKLNKLAQQRGGFLVDERIIYSLTLKDEYKNLQVCHQIKEYSGEQACQELIDLAMQCGEYSRFKIDKKIGGQKFIDLYTTWIKKSVIGEIAEKVFVYEVAGKNIGLLTLAVKNGYGSTGLLAVDNNFRGQKIGSRLFDAAKKYFAKNGLVKIIAVVQGKNISACRFHEKCGFLVFARENFYHFWL